MKKYILLLICLNFTSCPKTMGELLGVFLAFVDSNQEVKNYLEDTYSGITKNEEFVLILEFNNVKICVDIKNAKTSDTPAILVLPENKVLRQEDYMFIKRYIWDYTTNIEVAKDLIHFVDLAKSYLRFSTFCVNALVDIVSKDNFLSNQKKHLEILSATMKSCLCNQSWINKESQLQFYYFYSKTFDNLSCPQNTHIKHALLNELLFQHFFNLKLLANNLYFRKKQSSYILKGKTEEFNLIKCLEIFRYFLCVYENKIDTSVIIYTLINPNEKPNLELFDNKSIYQDDNFVREMINHEVFSEQELINLGFKKDFIQNCLL